MSVWGRLSFNLIDGRTFLLHFAGSYAKGEKNKVQKDVPPTKQQDSGRKRPTIRAKKT